MSLVTNHRAVSGHFRTSLPTTLVCEISLQAASSRFYGLGTEGTLVTLSCRGARTSGALPGNRGGFCARLVRIRPYGTEAVTRPNKEHHDSLEFPFPRLALAIRAEHDRNEAMIRPTVAKKYRFQRIGEIGCTMNNGWGDTRISFLPMR
jgi:hypothetical protein